MAIKTERVTVGAAQFEITQLGAEAGRGLYKKFLTAIEPLLRELLSGSGSVLPEIKKALEEKGENTQETVLAIAVQIMAPMVLRGIAMLPDALFEELCVRFSATCTVNAARDASGQAVFISLAEQFNGHFAGDYVSMTTWLGHCIRINGFLGLLGGGSTAQTTTPTTS